MIKINLVVPVTKKTNKIEFISWSYDILFDRFICCTGNVNLQKKLPFEMKNCDNLLCKQIVAFGQTGNAIVRFAHHSDSATDSIDFWGSGHDASIWVDFSNIELDWSMILGVDDTVTCRAAIKNRKKSIKIFRTICFV